MIEGVIRRLGALPRSILGEAHARRGAQLLLLFLLLRLALVAVTLLVPDGGVLLDSAAYLAMRDHIVDTGQLTDPQGDPLRELNWPPGYPGLLALIRAGFGGALWPVTLLQLALSGGLCLFALRWGERAAGARAGLLAGWILALSPNLAVWSLMIMSEVLFTALLVLASAALLGWKDRSLGGRAAISGALLGAAAYVRPIALVLLPAWAVSIALLAWRKRAGRAALKAALAFSLAAGLVTSAWVLRNYVTYGQAVFSTVGTRTMVNFNLAQVLADAEGISRERASARIEDGTGAVGLAVELLREHPVSFVKMMTFGVMRTSAGSDVGAWGHVLGWKDWTGLGLLSGLFGHESPVLDPGETTVWENRIRYGLLGISILHAAALLGLAALGVFAWPGERAQLLFWLPLLTIALLVLTPGAAGQARFRVPVEPYLALFAGVGGARLTRARWSAPQRAGDRDREVTG